MLRYRGSALIRPGLIGLALIVALARRRPDANADDLRLLRG